MSANSGADFMKGGNDPNVDVDTFIGDNMSTWKGIFTQKFGKMRPDLAGDLTETEVDLLLQSCISYAKRILVGSPDVPKVLFWVLFMKAVERLEVDKVGTAMTVSFKDKDPDSKNEETPISTSWPDEK